VSQEGEHDALHGEYQRLRSETEGSGRVPDFASMMARAKAEAARPASTANAGEQEGASAGRAARTHRMRRQDRHGRRRAVVFGGWAGAAVAAAIAAVLVADGRSGRADERFEHLVASYARETAGGAWRSPTSALLDVPGMSLTRTLPSVGHPLRDFDPSRPSERPNPEGRDS
jgi:hypothetical protein